MIFRYKKKTIIGGLFSGLVFAGMNAIFDFYNEKTFDLSLFMIRALCFGVGMGFFMNYQMRENEKKNI